MLLNISYLRIRIFIERFCMQGKVVTGIASKVLASNNMT